MGWNIAKTGALAGGLANGISTGMNIAKAKTGMDAVKQETAFKKAAQDRADVFSSLMKGLDKHSLNTVKSHFGMPMETVVDANAPEGPRVTDNPYAGAGLGTL
jgi:hypothetical protein